MTSQPSTIPDNFAPEKGLEDLREQPGDRFIKRTPLQFLEPLRQEMRREKESEEWRKRFKASQKNELYFRGYQNLTASPLSDLWYVNDPKPVNYTLNEFQFWVNVNAAKANASRIEFRIKGISDVEDVEMAAEKIRQIANHYDDKTWTRTKTIKAWKGLQFTGYMVAHVYYDPEAEAGKAYRPVTDRKPVKLGPDTYRCTECGYVGEIEENEHSETANDSGFDQSARNQTGTYPQNGGLRPRHDLPDQSGGMENGPGSGGPFRDDVSLSEIGGTFPETGARPDGMEGYDAFGEMPDDFQEGPTCARCGSDLLDITELPTRVQEIETGKEAYTPGDVCDEIISLYNITWNAKLGMEKSPIVLWEEDHDLEDLKATYQGINIPQQHTGDVALRTKEQLEHIGGTDNSGSKQVTLSRMWVEPRRYQNWELSEPVKTYKGVEFARGFHPIDEFPDGMHVIMIANTIVDWYAAVKNDDLVCLEYQGNPNGGLAQGCDAMCEPQRMSNTGHSLWNLWMRHHASPPKRYNPDMIDPGDISGDPTKPYPINTTMLLATPEHTIEKSMVADELTPFPNGIWEGLKSMRSFIQFAAYATEFTEGLPSVDNETLGGAQIAQGLAQSVSGVFLGPYADFRCEVVKRKLRKLQQNGFAERYIEFSGKYGSLEGITISGMDIPNDFEIEPVPGSWVPRTPQQRQQNLQALLTTTQGIQGLLAMPPAMRAEFCEIYDVKLDDDLYPVAIRTARMWIKQMAEALPDVLAANEMMAEMYEVFAPEPMEMEPDPAQEAMEPGMMDQEQMAPEGQGGTGMPPPIPPVTPGMQLLEVMTPKFNPRMKGLQEMADYVSSWFTTDEGLQAPPELIEAVGMFQDMCLDGLMKQGQAKNLLAMASMPPMPGPGAPLPGQKQLPAGAGGAG